MTRKFPSTDFSNPDPYAKVEPRPDDAPKRDIKFDENGNIVVKKSVCLLAARSDNRGMKSAAQNTQLQAAMRARKLLIKSSNALWSRTLPMMNLISRRMANE